MQAVYPANTKLKGHSAAENGTFPNFPGNYLLSFREGQKVSLEALEFDVPTPREWEWQEFLFLFLVVDAGTFFSGL